MSIGTRGLVVVGLIIGCIAPALDVVDAQARGRPSGQNPPPVDASRAPDGGGVDQIEQARLRVLHHPLGYNRQIGQFGGLMLITSDAMDNAIVGAVVQNGANHNSFPTGVTGYGLMAKSGNQAFGVYGQCDLGTAWQRLSGGTCANELDSFNFSGEPSTAFPPDLAFDTLQNNAISLQVAAYGNFDSSIGINIGYGARRYRAGLYIHPLAATLYGALIDATANDSAQYGAVIKSRSTGIPLQVQAVGERAPQNAAIAIVSGSGEPVAAIKQIGDFSGRAWISNGQSAPRISLCEGVGSGGRCAIDAGSNDGAGTIVLEGGRGAPYSGGSVSVIFSSPLGAHSSACQLQPAVNMKMHSSLVISGQDRSSFTFAFVNGERDGTALQEGMAYRINYFCAGL